ncbi:DUF2203 domain-containing protein [Litorilinea aerophila]|uniref:DUF2203 family protein n=1 Tax=Litorilinea aerophila TaxID=1204385 RepID=A0A540VE16_9CHLR|nr:DUF2203 domain-containing protein [Litorilinea aerophila]MCC9077328.1 DUF2203 domain-containing protein [Litorilinea aerophila]OUC05021.1 hypothetical protein RY27_29825 [Litorilinea aerophila]GIV79425.1 MAG: hypothetical protein KatS3mg050_3819 [Litorilinea sp.]
MNARYFTLAEARAILPQVKELMEHIQRARREILRLRPDAWPVLQKAATNGGSRAASDLYQEFCQLEKGVKGIMNLGVLVKDIDQGLVDFLGKRAGREIYLCWHYGEEDILYWHDLNAGYAGRRPIDDLVS